MNKDCLQASFDFVMAEPSKGDENRACSIVAYNGGIMKVSGFGNVAIDLQGIVTPKDGKMPILYGHCTDIDCVIGQTTEIKNTGKQILIAGEIMPACDKAKNVCELAKRGFKFQASIGCRVLKSHYVDAGQSENVNGAILTNANGFYVIEASSLHEISIVPLGADGSTSAQIAASQNNKGGAVMPTDEKKIDTAISAEQKIHDAVEAEKKRSADVIAACREHPDIAAKAVQENWTPERAELECLRKERNEFKAKAEKNDIKTVEAQRPEAPRIGNPFKNAPVTVDTLTAAACLGAGLESAKAEKKFGAEVCNQAHDLKINTLTDLVSAGIAHTGEYVRRHDVNDFIKAAFSTSSIPNVLTNTVKLFAIQGYGAIETAWQKITEKTSVVDFKAIKGVRLVMAGTLGDVDVNGTLEHVTLGDDYRTIQAKTKGSMVAIGRQDIINDSLGVLRDIPTKFGTMAARTFNKDFWAILNAATDSFTGSRRITGALSLDTLTTADANFGALVDKEGNPLGMGAAYLLCSPANRAIARNIYTSTNIVDGSAKRQVANNPFVGAYEPVVSSYLSSAPWYLTSSPMVCPLMEAAFLNGVETPTVETADADFDQLGIRIRCYFDYGVALGDTDGTVYSTGV